MSKQREKAPDPIVHDDDAGAARSKNDDALESLSHQPGSAPQTDDKRVSVQPTHKPASLVDSGAVPSLLATNLSAQRSKLSRLLIQADRRASDCVGEKISVIGYLIGHGTISVDGESGEVSVGHWLRMLTTEGKSISTTSPTLIRSFAALASLFSDGVWTPPVEIEIIAHASRVHSGKWLECYLVD